MTQTASNYGAVLFELGVQPEVIIETKRILSLTPQLLKELINPTLPQEKKQKLIRRIFPEEIQNFLCVQSMHHNLDELEDTLKAYEECYDRANGVIKAELFYVTKPGEAQEKKIKEYIRKKFHGQKVELKLVEKPDLIGGFVIRVGDEEIDQSLQGRVKELKQRLVWR
ncbi:MAG: ATP synthase F1 subunit delta [Lachnospiraceae bacterium]